MTTNELITVIQSLAKSRAVFHSEADFQHELAMILNQKTNKEIRLEKPFADISIKPGSKTTTKIELDILAVAEGLGIELKYKTKEAQLTVNNEDFNLRNHGAQNLGRYDFFDDIRRVQELKRSGLLNRGIVVFLTNDPTYWNQSTRRNLSTQFSMNEGRIINQKTTLGWEGNPTVRSVTKKRLAPFNPITIEHKIELSWKSYSNIGVSEFKFLLVEI